MYMYVCISVPYGTESKSPFSTQDIIEKIENIIIIRFKIFLLSKTYVLGSNHKTGFHC